MKKKKFFPLFFIFTLFFLVGKTALCDEYAENKAAFDAIGLSRAYMMGFTGAGVNVAVVDNGTLFTHEELKEQISSLQQDDFNIKFGDHGTPVAGVIAGAKNGIGTHGVAYNAKLISFSVGLGDDEPCAECYSSVGSWSALADSAFDDVKIINNSFGTGDHLGDPTGETAAYAYAWYMSILVAKDKLFVASAGNETTLSPVAAPAGVPYYYSSLKNNVISSISFDPTQPRSSPYFISGFTNLAIDAQEWSLAAPGEYIIAPSVTGDSEYQYFQGTSASAPVTSAVAALVQQAFPYMGGKQLADVLFSTADKDYSGFSKHMIQNWGGENTTRFLFFGTSDGFGKDWTDEEKLAIVKAELGDEFNCSSTGVACTDVSYADVFGQGIINAGEAVKGPKYFDANRLLSSDFSGSQYYYTVDTKGYNSTWSHNISQIKSKTENTGADIGLRKQGEGVLTLAGQNSFLGDVEIEGGSLKITGRLIGDIDVLGGEFWLAEGKSEGDVFIYTSGKLRVDGGKINNVTNDGTAVMNIGLIQNTLINAGTFTANGGAIDGLLQNTGDFHLAGGQIYNAFTNNGNFYFSAGRIDDVVTNADNFYFQGNSGVFTSPVQNTGATFTNEGILKQKNVVIGGTLVNTGTINPIQNSDQFINQGNILLIPNAAGTGFEVATLQNLNLISGQFTVDIKSLPSFAPNTPYPVLTAINGFTISSSFPSSSRLSDFISAETIADTGTKTVSVSFNYLDLGAAANTPNLTPVERHTAAIFNRLYQNQSLAEFSGYYHLNEMELKQEIIRLHDQVRPLQMTALPLSGSLSQNLSSHLYQRQGYQKINDYEAEIRRREYVPLKKDGSQYGRRGRSGSSTDTGDSNSSGFGMKSNIWGQFLFGQTKIESSKGSPRSDADGKNWGAMGGLDIATGDNFVFGVLGGYSKIKLDQDVDSLEIKDMRIGTYAHYESNYFSMNALVMLGYQNYDKTRGTILPTNTFENTASFDGTSIEGALNVGYDFYYITPKRGNISMRPYLGLNFAHMAQEHYTEKGDAATRLSVSKTTDNSFILQPGVTFGASLGRLNLYLFTIESLFADIHYQHALSGNTPKVSAYFVADPLQSSFDSLSDDDDKHAVVFSLGANGRIAENLKVNFQYTFRGSSAVQSHAGTATIMYSF